MSNCTHYRMPEKSWKLLIALYAATMDNRLMVRTESIRPLYIVAVNGHDSGTGISMRLACMDAIKLVTSKKGKSPKSPIYYGLTEEGVLACHLYESHLKNKTLQALITRDYLKPFQAEPDRRNVALKKKIIDAEIPKPVLVERKKSPCDWIKELPPYIPAHRRPAAAHLYARAAA